MYGYVDGIDWVNAEPMKYWSFPGSYKKDKRTETINLIFSGDYCGALKVDGYYQRLVKDEDGNCFMIARSKNVKGEAINKIDWVPQLKDFMNELDNGTVLLCECYLPGNEGSRKITSLLGCLKEKCIARQEKGQKLHFYIFDVCAENGKNYIDKPAEERFDLLNSFSRAYPNEYIEWARYYEGKELWYKIQEYLAEGREGGVIMKKDAPIYFKRTPARVSVKIKKELQDTVDVVIIGANPPTKEYNGKEIETWAYWINEVTGEKINKNMYKEYNLGEGYAPITKNFFNNWAGSLKIGLMKDGQLIQIGNLSGISDEVKENWRTYIGKVAEITGMEIFNDTGAIRHPKLVGFREDKKPEECDWKQIF